jgi:hypothetical protein
MLSTPAGSTAVALEGPALAAPLALVATAVCVALGFGGAADPCADCAAHEPAPAAAITAIAAPANVTLKSVIVTPKTAR